MTDVERADLLARIAVVEEANGCLQERLAALEATQAHVLRIGAAVDTLGRVSIGEQLERQRVMAERRAAQTAQEAI